MPTTLDQETCICTECLEDADLQTFIESSQEADVDSCSFCGSEGEGVVACRFLDLMHHIKLCIEEEYDLATNCLTWEGREGGWLGARHWDTPDLLRDQIGIGLPRDDDDSLFQAMCSYLEHTDWCERNPYGESPLNRSRFDWQEFTAVVKHHTRFFVDTYRKPRDPVLASERADPRSFLKAIGDAARRLDLFSDLPSGTILCRVRYQGSNLPFTQPGELGPPRCESAFVSNRMSPPGIVMFYCATDERTALAETCKETGSYSIGKFRTVRTLNVLDLTRLPEPPGFFAQLADSREWSRHEPVFFQEFVDDLTQPIERDDRVHLDYVPTQVIVEYFRRRFHHDLRTNPVDGVLYPSSRHKGGKSLVLFCDRSHIANIDDDDELFGPSEEPRWLELVGADSVMLSPEALAELTGSDDDDVVSGLSP